MADAVTVAQCPTNPEAEAVGTCARCGRFACQHSAGTPLPPMRWVSSPALASPAAR